MKLNEVIKILNGCTKKELIKVAKHYGWDMPKGLSKAQLLNRIKLEVLYVVTEK